ITIKQIDTNDWEIFRDVRLRALKTDPAVFGSNFERESAQTEDEWKEPLATVDCAIFIIFRDDSPIGMTAIAVKREDPTRKTAILWGSWLEPDSRRKGISKLMYQARLDWAKKHPDIEKIVVSHRASNHSSKFANQKHGFKYTHSESKTWHDGITEDDVHYELKIK
ncbi:MAG: GNAT family N-acetyltransferase, partial [Acidobacteria bacterium]|nr:GNAT family N-acetyltransferase [Acidobacteriota bacterium]